MDLLTKARSRIIFPHDTSDRAQLLRWGEQLGRYVGIAKVGLEAGCAIEVIGRPISDPPTDIGSSEQAAQRIAEEIAEALAQRPS